MKSKFNFNSLRGRTLTMFKVDKIAIEIKHIIEDKNGEIFASAGPIQDLP
jgi:hypothetical protein